VCGSEDLHTKYLRKIGNYLPPIECNISVGQDSSVGISTHYGLDSPEIESRLGGDFPHPSRAALGPFRPPIQGVTSLFPCVNRPGRGVDYTSPSSTELKGRFHLYF